MKLHADAPNSVSQFSFFQPLKPLCNVGSDDEEIPSTSITLSEREKKFSRNESPSSSDIRNFLLDSTQDSESLFDESQPAEKSNSTEENDENFNYDKNSEDKNEDLNQSIDSNLLGLEQDNPYLSNNKISDDDDEKEIVQQEWHHRHHNLHELDMFVSKYLPMG